MAGEDWWRGAVIYQIYPRSFMDSSGDGVGDLNGVAQKLDYVTSLGVDGIWLSPFFRSPMRDFGYDVSDYRDVDPLFGNLADFDALLKAAHDRGLKVIIDQVWSHTSSDHPWFVESRKSRDWQAPRIRLVGSDEGIDRRDWYVWADPRPDGSPPNNWQAWFGGPAWTWEPRRRQYYLHNFLPTQPDLNLRNPAVQDAILDVARFWLDRGVDGFRLDVANYYIHDALLRDNPPSGKADPALPRDMQVHAYNSDQPETLDFLSRVRALTDSYGGRMMVGELAPGGHALMTQYTAGRTRLHTAYAFDFLGRLPDAARFGDILSQWREGADDGWPSWAFSNHDVTRVATRWASEGGRPWLEAEAALALLLCLRGTAFIYQGEELGLPEAELEFHQLKDPWGIAGWPATKGRDGCRTPMPWTAGPRGGFTSDGATPWLPVSLDHRRASVSEQEKDPASFLNRARSLVALRQSNDALARGGFSLRSSTNGLLAFERHHGEQRVLCAFNIGGSDGVRGAATQDMAAKGDLLWANGARLAVGSLTVDPGGGAIVRLA
jgi:alpha-glucosidase